MLRNRQDTDPTTHRWGAVACVLLLVLGGCLSTACRTTAKFSPAKREEAQQAQQLRELNQRVMRFADEYAGRVREATTQFQTTVPNPEERLAAQNWKLQQVESAYIIASGPSAATNALDMVVLATLSRMVLDDSWVAELYGKRARPLQEAQRKLEDGAWQLVSGLLTESQIAQLHDTIDQWRAQNPNVRAVAYIHFGDLVRSIGGPKAGEEHRPGSLFALVGLDPLAQLDPAVREIAQARELADRTMYYMQRAPTLLEMQMERLTYQWAVMPETKSLLADADRAALVGTAADRVSRTFPDVLAREREALIAQLMQELDDRRATLGSLSTELRTTLQAGTETANSVHAALETFDRIAARYPPKGAAAGGAADSRPFDITEYTEMARQLAATTREINALAQRVDSLAPAVRSVTDVAVMRIDGLLDRAFVLLLVLVLTAVAATLLAALAYRAMLARMQRGRGAGAGPRA